MSSQFILLFASDDDPDGGKDEGKGWTGRPPRQAPWMGPSEDELGVVVQLGLVIGRSENGVVALRHATVFGEGVAFDVVALARGLRKAQSSRLLHEQHMFDPEEGPSDAFLRVGMELPDGRRVSNLGGRRARFASIEKQPDGPVFFEHGGGGGSGGDGRVRIQPAFWLWPLPGEGSIQVFCEWPAVEIPLSSVELVVAPLVEARSRVLPLWPPG